MKIKGTIISMLILLLAACSSTQAPVEEPAGPTAPPTTTEDTAVSSDEIVAAVEASADGDAQGSDPLAGTMWTLLNYQNKEGAMTNSLADTPVTIEFQDGGYSGNASCNRYFGSYQVDGSSLSLGITGSTEMYCGPEEVMVQESDYLAALGQVSQYQIEGSQLSLADKEGNFLLIYTMKQPISLTGTVWQGIGYNNGQGGVVSDALSTQITAAFGTDGTLAGSTGCNNYNTTYTTDGNNITISPQIATTRRACNQEQTTQETAYLAALPKAATYQFVDDRLELRDENGALLANYSAQPQVSLADLNWNAITYHSGGQAMVSVLGEAPITAVFAADGTVSGSGGCNSYTGSYTISGSNITVGPLASTMMACAENVMQQETAYLAALQSATSYQITGDILELRLTDGSLAVSYVGANAPGLAGSSWDVISYNNGNQAVVTVMVGTEMTAQFGEGGTLSGFAGCNNYTTSYQVDGENIVIGPAVSTKMFCESPTGVMDQETQYLAALSTAVTYYIDGPRMEMRDAAGAMVANFQAAGSVDPELQNFLANASYQVAEAAAGSVALVNGEYREPLVEGGAAELVVLWTGTADTGTLNDQPVVATIITVSTGGSGTFYYLAVFTQDENGQLVNTAMTPLGDRIIVNLLDMTSNAIVMQVVQAGEDDPMCCPTEAVERIYSLEGNELVIVSETVLEP